MNQHKTISNMIAKHKNRRTVSPTGVSIFLAKNYGGKLVRDSKVVEKIKSLVKVAKQFLPVGYYISGSLVETRQDDNIVYEFRACVYHITKRAMRYSMIVDSYENVEDFLAAEINAEELVPSIYF